MGWRNWLKKYTKFERGLILTVAALSAVVLVLFIVVLSSAHGQQTCDSPECVRAATHILETVDPSINPCDDFYQFACGTFLKHAFALGQPTTLHNFRTIMKNQLKEIVVEKTNRQNVSRAVQMQKKFYRGCINETAVEEDNDTTLVKLLDEVTGGWPVVKSYSWPERDFEWTKATVQARKLGLFYQFFVRVEVYFGNDSTGRIWIRPPFEKDISSSYWHKENLDHMIQIAADLGSQSVGKSTDLRRTLDFTEQLIMIVQKHYSKSEENEPIEGYKNVTVGKLEHAFIKIHWLDFLRNITNVALTDNDEVIFDANEYFKDLYFLLMKTAKKIQANYIAWSIVSTNSHYTTKKIRDEFANMRKVVNDTDLTLSRTDLCYKKSTELFKNVAEGEYIRRHTPASKRKYIKELIHNVKTELQLVLEDLNWMDEETKTLAVLHLKNITEEVGWTELVYDAKKFERFFGYNQLKMTSDKLVDMARLAVINAVNQYYRQLRQTNREEEEEYVNTPKLDVNAFYLKYFDKLILPTPILQGHVFNERRPHYMNYGALGSIIGHEFMHGIIESDSDETWWSNRTTKTFKKISQCIIDEHDTYLGMSDLSANATVFEENVADFSGVNLAYTAYRKWSREHGLEDKLPGIQYTPNQLFWIMTSTYLCHESKPSEKDKRKEAMHATPSYRVIGRLQHSPHFAKDFDCPEGSPMNPRNKCRIFA